MAGSLRPVAGKPNTWELRVYLGRDVEGRTRHKHARFHGTKREAERELTRMVAAQDAAPAPVVDEPKLWGPGTTINDAITAWRDNGWDDLSPKTARHYESIWRVHIEPTIGRRKIANLGPYDVERYYRSLKTSGLSQATVRQIKAVLHRSCRLAQKWSGGTLRNPAADADLPVWKLDERRPEVRAPQPEEVRALLAAAGSGDPRIATFLRVLAAAGLRRGEACALRWLDVDLDHRVITVDESVVTAKGGAVVKAPKTSASIRKVALDTATAAAIAELRVEQEALAASAGVAVEQKSFVFSFEPGGEVPPYPDSFSHAMTRLRTRAGIAPDIHLHSLRHFHATALDPVISEAQKQARLGWSTVQMARHYTDGVPEEDRRAADHLGQMLANKKKSRRPSQPQAAG